jgi:hypothetical protein
LFPTTAGRDPAWVRNAPGVTARELMTRVVTTAARPRPGDYDTVQAIREHRAARLLAAQFASPIILI